jgi:exodeoxyribonuclease V alpha subunit
MINYSEEQYKAIELCADRSKKLVGITGEAGTGKTTILKKVYEDSEYSYGDSDTENSHTAIVAPTGRAAKRVQEATGIPARTIHRFLRWSVPDDDDEHGLPVYDKYNKYPYKTVLVDEASMVSEELYRPLIDAMPAGGVIRFFGDNNQLPPVEGKSPFANILTKFPSITLTENFRSTDGVVTAARQIVRGRIPEHNDQFTMLNPGNGNILPALEKFIDDSFRGLGGQLIIPTKIGKYGTQAMNKLLQQKLNGKGEALRYQWKDKFDEVHERKFRVGDKVIWTKNDYKLNLFNGQIGWITAIDTDTGEITLNMDGRDKLIPTHLESYDKDGRAIFVYDPRKQLDLAYAITTHKAQGSEFDRVVLLLNKTYVLNRANFYTAVTRAKKHVTVILGAGALHQAMKK